MKDLMSEPVDYRWRYDERYYVTMIDRYYQQLSCWLQLPTQFGILMALGVAVF